MNGKAPSRGAIFSTTSSITGQRISNVGDRIEHSEDIEAVKSVEKDL
jgi:hypothetical protein